MKGITFTLLSNLREPWIFSSTDGTFTNHTCFSEWRRQCYLASDVCYHRGSNSIFAPSVSPNDAIKNTGFAPPLFKSIIYMSLQRYTKLQLIPRRTDEDVYPC